MTPLLSTAIAELLEQGKARGHVLEQDVEALFDDRAEPPDDAEVDAARQLLIDGGVLVLADEAELEEVEQIVEDTEAERLHNERQDRAAAARAPLQTDSVAQYLKDIYDIPLL